MSKKRTKNHMMQRLFGVETEYAFSVWDSKKERLDSGKALCRLMDLAGRRLDCLPDETFSGVFLPNGARFYVDAGDHPEFGTPECDNPWDVVRYIQAGERILGSLAQALEEDEESEVTEAVVRRSNVDYSGTGSTWGCHESYLHREDPRAFREQLISHLVSRLVYTGAGGFNSLRRGGLEFTLSPRVFHLQHEVSGESTDSRGIFHTKDESHSSEGYHRLHVLCGESLCSERSIWLKVGTTALVVALIDGGVRPGDGLQLHSPLMAIRQFAVDPYCRTRSKLRNGGELSALEIQRHYLRQAEAHLHSDFMPPFSEAVCEQWRAILDKLEDAPESVATELDWAIKFPLYVNRARRHGVTWKSLPRWNDALAKLTEPYREKLARGEPVPVDAMLKELGSSSPVGRRMAVCLRRHRLNRVELKPFVRLREELFEIDTRFGQLGDGGIFSIMDREGVLSHHVPGVNNIGHAVENPPAVGRARVRGESIRKLARKRDHYISSWEGIWDWESRRRLDLTDPFATTTPEWQEWKVDQEQVESMRHRIWGSWLRGRPSQIPFDFLRRPWD